MSGYGGGHMGAEFNKVTAYWTLQKKGKKLFLSGCGYKANVTLSLISFCVAIKRNEKAPGLMLALDLLNLPLDIHWRIITPLMLSDNLISPLKLKPSEQFLSESSCSTFCFSNQRDNDCVCNHCFLFICQQHDSYFPTNVSVKNWSRRLKFSDYIRLRL